MLMKGLSAAFLGTVIAIPVVGQISPEGAVDAISVGNVQTVLAYAAVIEFIALSTLFALWRKDVVRQQERSEEKAKELSELLAQNTAVIAQNKDAGHRQAHALEALEQSVSTFSDAVNRNSEVIRKCEK